jgi:5,5'-dehydrodivanillate O-demethylase
VLIADPVEVLPCNYWNRLDNDHGHRAWVHRATALRKNRRDILVIRDEAIEEVDYGLRGHRKAAGAKDDAKSSVGVMKGEKTAAQDGIRMARYKHWFMPNARLWFQRTRAPGYEGRELWETKAVWTVPINDERHASFDVTLTPLTGAEGRAYEKARKEAQEREAETRWDLAEAVLAGEMTLEDLPADMSAYTSFTIEDYVTQVGQGPIATRGEELLTVSEERLVMLRRLWLREVSALVDGKPLTEWRMPTEPFIGAEA